MRTVPAPTPTASVHASVLALRSPGSFAGDRHLTPWVPLLGQDAPAVPLVEVTLRRSGEELLGATAEVLEAPQEYQQRHPVLVAELRNVTHWPKHVLVHYQFDTRNEVDLDRGLYLLFPAGEGVGDVGDKFIEILVWKKVHITIWWARLGTLLEERQMREASGGLTCGCSRSLRNGTEW